MGLYHGHPNMLIEGLVGTKHLSLYLNSAPFHAQITTIAQMLPTVIDALAVSVVEGQAHHAAMIKHLSINVPPMARRVEEHDVTCMKPCCDWRWDS